MSTLLKTAPLALGALLALAGCASEDPNKLLGDGSGDNCETGTTTGTGAGTGSGTGSGATTGSGSGSTGTGDTTSSTGTGMEEPIPTELDERTLSYTEAYRTASLKLVGDLPPLQKMEALRTAANPKVIYEAYIDEMMLDTRFSKRMVEFWKNTMRMGGAASGNTPSRDTAPTFAAKITVQGLPYTNLFTADTNTCPTFDGTNFVDGSCSNGPETAGVLTDPGAQAQYFGNLAFRRVRFYQETFVCRKQPAEFSDNPQPMGAGSYTSPWPFESIGATVNGGRIDFQDVSSAICANCHTTSNHRAPLMAVFDANGQYQAPQGTGQSTTYTVLIPVTGSPQAMLSDFLPAGETTAWKFGYPVSNLKEMGQAMAQDDEVLACAVSRIWNFAMGKGDIVVDGAIIPTEVIQPLIDEFKADNFNLRTTIRSAFVHDDFVRF